MNQKTLLTLLIALALLAAPLEAAEKKAKPTSPTSPTKPTKPTKPAPDVAAGKAPDKPATKSSSTKSFRYVGQWRGYKKGKRGFGTGTVSLISPSWAITAFHVASKEIRTPDAVNSVVEFRVPGTGRTRSITVNVKKAYGGFKGDFALLHLAKPIGLVPKVALLADPIVRSDGTINFTMIGHKGGLNVHQGRKGHSKDGEGFYHSEGPDGRPGKAGDSGGAWVIERGGKKPDVQFAVIHGGGKGPQIAPNQKRINEIIAKATPKEKVEWVRKADLPKFKKKPAAKPAPKKKAAKSAKKKSEKKKSAPKKP